ncbi:MAG: HTH domain-containing protein [Erysipelotrichaceae bacterium]|nr:HTH domain-containing protein [Erysipelotrichaceae bacterium]
MNIKVFDFLRFLLLNSDSLYSIKDLSKRFNVTERTIQNYLSSIESFF